MQVSTPCKMENSLTGRLCNESYCWMNLRLGPGQNSAITQVLQNLDEHRLTDRYYNILIINPLNAELNLIRHLLALVGARHIVHVSGIRVHKILEIRKTRERRKGMRREQKNNARTDNPEIQVFALVKVKILVALFIFRLLTPAFTCSIFRLDG